MTCAILLLLATAGVHRLNVKPATPEAVVELLGPKTAESLAPVVNMGLIVTNKSDSPVLSILAHWIHEVDGAALSYSFGDEVYRDQRKHVIAAGETVFVAPRVIARSGVEFRLQKGYFDDLDLGKVLSAGLDSAIFADNAVEGPNVLDFAASLAARGFVAKSLLAEHPFTPADRWEKFWFSVLRDEPRGRLEAIKGPVVVRPKARRPVIAAGSKNKVVSFTCSSMSQNLPLAYVYERIPDPPANPTLCHLYGFDNWAEIIVIGDANCGNGSYFKTISKRAGAYAGATWDAAFLDCQTKKPNGATECECFILPDGRWFDVKVGPYSDTGIYAEARMLSNGPNICSSTPIATAYGVSTCDGSRQEIGSEPSPNAWCNVYNIYSPSGYGAGFSHYGAR